MAREPNSSAAVPERQVAGRVQVLPEPRRHGVRRKLLYRRWTSVQGISWLCIVRGKLLYRRRTSVEGISWLCIVWRKLLYRTQENLCTRYGILWLCIVRGKLLYPRRTSVQGTYTMHMDSSMEITLPHENLCTRYTMNMYGSRETTLSAGEPLYKLYHEYV